MRVVEEIVGKTQWYVVGEGGKEEEIPFLKRVLRCNEGVLEERNACE